jgi:ATP phosphoribosyltransferase
LDAGITGKDWTQENESDVHVVAEMVYSKVTFRPTRWVLAVPHDSPITKLEDLKGKCIATEMVKFTKRYFAERNIPVQVEFYWGATEAKAAEGMVDAIVEVTETGTTIRAHGLKIIAEFVGVSVPSSLPTRKRGKTPGRERKSSRSSCYSRRSFRREQSRHQVECPEVDLDKVIQLIPSITAPPSPPCINPPRSRA